MNSLSYKLAEATEHLRQQPLLREVSGSAIICGDLHGDLDALNQVTEMYQNNDEENLVFLGDYVDRGPKQLEVLNSITDLILDNNHVIPLRGNHEDIRVNQRYGFLDIAHSNNVEEDILGQFYANLPIAAVSSEVFMVHGGIPIEPNFSVTAINSLDRVSQISSNEVTQLLWNDPVLDDEKSMTDYLPSPRGGNCYQFGQKVTDNFFRKNDLSLIARAHTFLPEGHKWYQNRKVLSLFTSNGGPYKKVNRKIGKLDLADPSTSEIVVLDN